MEREAEKLEGIKSSRQAVYGDPRENHRGIAQIWSSLLQPFAVRIRRGIPIPEHVVANMFEGLKLNRKRRVFHEDNYDDGRIYSEFARDWQRDFVPSPHEREWGRRRGQLRVYIAGPYSSSLPMGEIGNTERAIEVGASVMRMGHQVFVPHAATHFLATKCLDADYEDWMEFDFGIIETWADCLYMYAESPGALREVAFAKSLGIPVYTSLEQIPKVS